MLKVKETRLMENTGLLRYANPETYEQLIESLDFHLVKYVNKQIIFRQDERVDQLAIVVDGMVRGQKIHGISDSEMVHVFREGELFAYEGILSSSKVAPMDYISDGDSQIMLIEVGSVMNSPFAKELMTGIAGYMADDSIRKSYRIEAISKKKLRERVLTYLRIRAQESGTNSVTLGMTREEMAEELCVNRTALSKELSNMQSDGLIIVQKGKIILI